MQAKTDKRYRWIIALVFLIMTVAGPLGDGRLRYAVG